MGSLVDAILSLPEGPQYEFLEKIGYSYCIYIRHLTLHIHCIDFAQSGGPEDLVYALLACRLKLVEKVRFYTYKVSFQRDFLGDRARVVRLLRQEDFTPFLQLVNQGIPIEFEDYERPIVEAWKDGQDIEPVCKRVYNAPDPSDSARFYFGTSIKAGIW